jgi:gas vesicle protein
MAEQVTIKINVRADTAAIERLRAQLKSLCREANDCGDTFDKYTKRLDDTGKGHRRLGEQSEGHRKKQSSLLKGVKKLQDGFQSLAKLGLKYVAIEAAAAFAVIGSSALLFKSGAALAKGYQMALSGVSYAFAAVVAAGAAFLAVQQQFASVQFAPMFQKGLVNTEDRFEAADLAMRSFVNSSELSVFGTKALTAAFGEMAKNLDPSKLGMATGAMRTLGNVAAGMGGDIGKNFGEVSKFASSFAKEGTLTDAVKKQGEGLSPIFKKVIEEQSKAGNTTYEKFMAGLATNKTFQDAYAGQLDAVNNTVMGRIKGAFTDIKSMLTDMGGPMLNPLGDAVTKIKHMIEALLIRIRGTVSEVGSGSLIDGLVKGVEKVTLLLGKLMTHDIHQAGSAIDGIKNAWGAITRGFEKIQDYLRPLQDAASVLWKTIKPILGAFTGNLNSSIQMLSDSLVENEDKFVNFGSAIGAFLTSVGNFGTSLKKVFIDVMPTLGGFIKTLGKTFEMVGKSLESATPAIKTLVRIADVLLKAFNFVYKVVEKIGHAIEFMLTPLTAMLKLLTFGVVDFTRGVTSLVMATTMLIGLGKLKGGMFSKPFDLIKGQLGKRAAAKAAAEGAAGQAAPAAAGGAGGAGAATMLGGAAIAAGGVYGAYKAGDLSSKLFKDDSIASKAGAAGTGALGGAAAGAAAGAALGLLGGPFAPLTSTVGAIGGAVIGGIIGGVSGWFGAGKEKKKAREAAHNFLESYTSEVNEAFAQGDVEGLLALKSDFEKKAKEAAKGNMDVYYAELAKMQPEIDALSRRIEMFSKNAEHLGKYLGLDGDKLNQLSEDLGINFQNRLVSVFEIIGRAGEQLGIDLAGFFNNVLGEIDQKQTSMLLDLIDAPGEMREIGKQVDAAQATVMSGDTSAGALEELVKQQFLFSSAQTGGDPMKALQLTTDFIKAQGGEGGALEGKSGMLMDTIQNMGLLDPQQLVKIATESGQVDLMAAELSRVSGVGLESTKNTLLNQIATGGMGAFTQQEELLKSYALTEAGKTGGISREDFLSYGYGGAAGLATGANLALTTQGAMGTYGGGGVNLTPPPPVAMMNPFMLGSSIGPGGTGTIAPNTSTQTITVGETKISVSGILSPSEAQQIANAVAKAQSSIGERLGGAFGSRRPAAPVE